MRRPKNPEKSQYIIIKIDRETGEQIEVNRIKGQANAEWLVEKLNRELRMRGEDKDGFVSHYWK